MSTLDASAAAHLGQHDAHGGNYLTHGRGFLSWAGTLDHKRIGVMYLVGILCAFLLGGLFALLVRSFLLVPIKTDPTGDLANWYNRFFTLHGAIMVFVVIIPGIPAALGNFVLPIMLGAKDVAFPRLNLLSFYLWCAGTLLLLSTLVKGGVDTGWTFYTPYSTRTAGGAMSTAIPALFGVFIIGFSSILTGLNFIVTIHKLRRPEMTWYKLPLFVWAIYSTAVIQVLATPVIGITTLLLFVERVLGVGIFSPEYGGDPVLMQHFFWFYSHPAVYIMILPAMGVMSELISVFSHKHIFGYRYIGFSSVSIAILSFIVWGHHMFVAGQSNLTNVIFSALTFSVAVPSAIKMFNWLATMHKGSIELKVPMQYALSFMWIFGIGGLTGLFLGTLAVDIHLHDTYFVVAHFHYVMAGTIFVFFGAVHYWWPKMTGKMYNERWASLASFLLFLGFNMTFFAQFIMGAHGMPRRYFNYPEQFHPFHVVSSSGSYVMAAGIIIMGITLARSLRHGKPAPRNPWGSATLEWTVPSPPPHDNFDKVPYAGDPYDYESIEYDPQTDSYYTKPAAQPAPVVAAKPAH